MVLIKRAEPNENFCVSTAGQIKNIQLHYKIEAAHLCICCVEFDCTCSNLVLLDDFLKTESNVVAAGFHTIALLENFAVFVRCFWRLLPDANKSV